MAKTAKPPEPSAAGTADESLVPRDRTACTIEIGGRRLGLTNLGKVFWPDAGIT
jgi:hypothetical protein